MPPTAKKGIIKSGNAGNKTAAPVVPPTGGEKPLFPAGSKYPLSLLQERCQKNGWEKPIVDTRKHSNGWSFVVTLSKFNKKTSQKESALLQPHPPYIVASPLEARHWGATYALYRFCNGIQLNRILPPGPRDYWNELEAEHKAVVEHMKWMYDADPFAAKKEVTERQAKAAQRKEESSSTDGQRSGQVSTEYAQAPEVKMASALRDMVEDAVKRAISLYPEAAPDLAPSVLLEENVPATLQQLKHLGFTSVQARNATTFLSLPSALTSSLLCSLSPLEASIEYLVLHVPECDLPQRFLPTSNSSNPFITSSYAGTDDLKKRWIEDKAIKEAGWPARVVNECTSDPRFLESWELMVAALGRKLIGEDWNDLFTAATGASSGTQSINAEEVEALGAHYVDPSHLIMPLFTSPVQLHILLEDNLYAYTGHPPMYITSTSVPSYIRLHLLSQLLRAVRSSNFVEQGEGFCMAAMRLLEGEWALIEDNGPPDMSAVLEHIVPRLPPSALDLGVTTDAFAKQRVRRAGKQHDNRSDSQIKDEFETIRRSDKYMALHSTREKLPAFAAKEEFLGKLEKHRVLVVVGETGCGKTTQLPQFILDSLILSGCGSKASIIITQPRRISAISVAARVSSERCDDGSVGYAIRGESKRDKRTKLLFCTTGVILRRLGSGDRLEDVTHVIVDEVHERSVDGDFLLLELKELLSKHKNLRVILMSATINHETFVKYFSGAPLLTIPGFAHPVTDMYLEDVIQQIDYRPSTRTNKKPRDEQQRAFYEDFHAKGLDEQSINAIRHISLSERIDFQLIAAVVSHIVSTAKTRGGILIFLPGVQEIRQCMDAVRSSLAGDQLDILPLHANLSSSEQRKVFTATTKWKIIAATNVAETSITIDDVVYVIDAGKVKETQYDPEISLSRLVETWVTRAAARQRRGRAGRTRPGVCYKLYTRRQEENMAKFPVPEILRVPLESLSLTVKVMREEEDVKLFLSRAIDPPKIVAMERAWSILEELGAVDQEGRLTALGRHMSMIPVDLRLAKMLVLGTIFQCLDPILTIAACLSSKPLFLSPMDKRDEATLARARFSTGGSDLLTNLHAYDECIRLRSEGKHNSTIMRFCEDNFISSTAVREITTLRHDFISSLADIGFVSLSDTPASPGLNTNSKNTNLLKAVILGGVWPRVARVHLPQSAIKFDKVQAGTVQRENTAREFKMFDLQEDARVFLHPASVLFGAAAWKAPFLVYFHKHKTAKIFLRDATEVPLYALLLFGGPVSVNHVGGGVTIGSQHGRIKLKAWPRIGILVNQLRRLLDAQLQRCIETGSTLTIGGDNPVLKAILALLTADGLSQLNL